MSESKEPGLFDVFAAFVFGRKAAQHGVQPMTEKDKKAAELLAKNPVTQADFLTGARQTHWSNLKGPTGGMPPDGPLGPETPSQPPPPKPKP